MCKWIGSYNLYCIQLIRFFKWLFSPDIEPDKRPKPAVVQNIPQIRRKEKSIYKPSDLWTNEEDLLFLRYCPSSRMKCYHSVVRDTGCRPHEIRMRTTQMCNQVLIWKVGVGQMNTILPFAAYFGFTYAYSNMLAGRKIKRAREPRQPKKVNQ
jgi:hypothetical protein